MGCFEVSIGDTTGAATVREIEAVFHECSRHAPMEAFAGHFHDTYGQALTNVLAALHMGVRAWLSLLGCTIHCWKPAGRCTSTAGQMAC